MMIKSILTKKEFIKRLNKKHNNFYDYSKVEFESLFDKIIIICPIHGEFKQQAKLHRLGQGCPKCGDSKKGSSKKDTTKSFIKKARKVHGYKYDYSKVEYLSSQKHVIIICKKHGEFLQTPNVHLRGRNCYKCYLEKNSKDKHYSTKIFIKKAKEIHGGLYDYSKVNYISNRKPIEIICKVHGSFFQRPVYHLQGNGCQKCNMSIGERKIYTFLEKHKIKFEMQKRFKDCKDQRPLPFDFYLPEKNMCIEFDGDQHFSDRYKFSRGRGSLEKVQKRDKIKNEYCKQNNIKLLRISCFKIRKVNNILSECLL